MINGTHLVAFVLGTLCYWAVDEFTKWQASSRSKRQTSTRTFGTTVCLCGTRHPIMSDCPSCIEALRKLDERIKARNG